MRLENVVDGEGKSGLWYSFIVLMLEVRGQQRGQGQLWEPLEAGKAQVRVEEHHGRDHHRGEEWQRGRGRHAQRGRVILARGGACKYRVTKK
mgnify:CR=1 FL=1